MYQWPDHQVVAGWWWVSDKSVMFETRPLQRQATSEWWCKSTGFPSAFTRRTLKFCCCCCCWCFFFVVFFSSDIWLVMYFVTCTVFANECKHWSVVQVLYPQSDKTYCRQISWSVEAARLDVIMIISLWNLTGFSAALLPRCLSNFGAIGKV